MSQGMNRDRAVETGLHKSILENDTDIARFDGLRIHSSAMGLENEVVTGIPLLEVS